MKRHIRNAFERSLNLLDDGLEVDTIMDIVKDRYNLTDEEVKLVRGYTEDEIVQEVG